MNPHISIVVIKYNEPFGLIKDCLESIGKQKNVKLEVIFLDQIGNNNYEQYLESITSENIKFKYYVIPDIGLSYGRNLGIDLSSSDFVAFTDPDCILDDNWAFELHKTFHDDVAIVGGKVIPEWLKEPKWYHKSKLISEMYSLIDLSDNIHKTNKICGANFAVNKKIIKKIGNFDERFGRKGGTLLSGEETDLCNKIIVGGYTIVYNPFAFILHQIPKDRINVKWVSRRIFYGGTSRALKGGKPKAYHKEKNCYDYVIFPFFLLIYLMGFLYGKITIKSGTKQ